MPVTTIESKGRVLAKKIPISEWEEGLRFFSEEQDFIQVGTWNYNTGETLGPHIHNEVPRTVTYTCEVLFVYSGMVMASIYDRDEQLVERVALREGDTLVLLDGGHGYEVLEDGTRVLEVKNGLYFGADIDRRIIALVGRRRTD